MQGENVNAAQSLGECQEYPYPVEFSSLTPIAQRRGRGRSPSGPEFQANCVPRAGSFPFEPGPPGGRPLPQAYLVGAGCAAGAGDDAGAGAVAFFVGADWVSSVRSWPQRRGISTKTLM